MWSQKSVIHIDGFIIMYKLKLFTEFFITLSSKMSLKHNKIRISASSPYFVTFKFLTVQKVNYPEMIKIFKGKFKGKFFAPITLQLSLEMPSLHFCPLTELLKNCRIEK